MTKSQTRMTMTWSIAVAAAVVIGCGGSGQDVAIVRGSVHYDGQPLTKGAVMFQASSGRLGRGDIQPDGSFEISTYGVGDGAIVGSSRIAVVCARIDGDPRSAGGATKKWLIPESFGNVGTSRLQCDVNDVGANVFRITLNSDGTGTVVQEQE